MSGGIGDVYVHVGAKLAPGADKAIRDGVVPAADRVGTEAGRRIGDSMRRMITGALAIAAGAGAVNFLRDAISEAREAEAVGRQTEAVIKSTGGAAKITADQVGDLALALSNKTAVDDEAIQSASNLLLTFTNVRNEAGKGNDIFNQATKTAVDLSAALGTDLNSSALMLGKALNDPIAGMTALGRAGVQLTTAQKDQIKSMVAMGDTLGAQKLLLAEVAKQVGGSAEAIATPAEKAMIAWGNFKEQVGTAIIPMLDRLATVGMERVLPAFEAAIPAATQFVDSFGDIAAGGLQLTATLLPVIADGVNLLVDIMPGGATTVAAFFAAWKLGALSGVAGLLKGIGGELRAGWLEGMAEAGVETSSFTGKVGGLKSTLLGFAGPLAAGAVFIGLREALIGVGDESERVRAQLPQLGQAIVTAMTTGNERVDAAVAAFDKAEAASRKLASAELDRAQLNNQFVGGSQYVNTQTIAMEENSTATLLSAETYKKFGEIAYQNLTKVEQAQVQAQQAQQVYDQAVAAHGPNSQAASLAQQQLAAATQQVTAQQNAANAATQTGTQALAAYMNQAFAATNATFAKAMADQNVAAAQTAYNDALAAGTTSAGAMSQQEIALGQSMIQGAMAAGDAAAKQAELEGQTDTTAASTSAALAQLQAYAQAAGGNVPPAVQQMIAQLQAQQAQQGSTGASASAAAGQVSGYGSTILALPPSKTTYIKQDGAEGATEQIKTVQRSIDALTNKTVTVTTVYQVEYTGGSGYAPTGTVGVMATGGAVHGPGTGTSDSILTRLSNGEHVFTAAEVRRAGGQQAVYALRRAIMDGSLQIPGYAEGGPVSVRPLPSVSSPLVIGGPIYLQIEGFDGVFRASVRNVAQGVVDQHDSSMAATVTRREL